jgi:hypothetical protein
VSNVDGRRDIRRYLLLFVPELLTWIRRGRNPSKRRWHGELPNMYRRGLNVFHFVFSADTVELFFNPRIITERSKEFRCFLLVVTPIHWGNIMSKLELAIYLGGQSSRYTSFRCSQNQTAFRLPNFRGLIRTESSNFPPEKSHPPSRLSMPPGHNRSLCNSLK